MKPFVFDLPFSGTCISVLNFNEYVLNQASLLIWIEGCLIIVSFWYLRNHILVLLRCLYFKWLGSNSNSILISRWFKSFSPKQFFLPRLSIFEFVWRESFSWLELQLLLLWHRHFLSEKISIMPLVMLVSYFKGWLASFELGA